MQLKKKFCYLACKPPVYVFQERQHWINLELVSGIPWRIDIALKAKSTRGFLGLFLYDPNIKAFLIPNECVMNKCFLSKADISDDHFEGRFRRTSWMFNLPRKVYGAKSVDLSTHLLQTMPGGTGDSSPQTIQTIHYQVSRMQRKKSGMKPEII